MRGEQAHQKYDSCKTVVGGLNKIIIDQNNSIQQSIWDIAVLNDSIATANEKYNAASVKLQQAKDKKRPWYEWAALIVAFLTGASIR